MAPSLARLLLAGLCSIVLGSAAIAGGLQAPGSLLVFPLFDNNRAVRTIFTVTNTADHDVTPGAQGTSGQLRVEYVYIRHEDQFLPGGALNPFFALDCTEFNRTRIFTAKDTLTVDAKLDNPNATHRGYLYAFAKNAAGVAISWNWLIGTARVLSATSFENHEFTAIAYTAIGAETASTDTNFNGQRDFDGAEYEKTPDTLLFPLFIGSGFEPVAPFLPPTQSELILIALTGGSQFTTLVDLIVYNDNEEVFSANDSVRCWSSKLLHDISGVFTNTFLLSTNHNASEGFGSVEFPSFDLEAGWFSAHGLVASSSSTTIPNNTPGTTENPAILGVLLETTVALVRIGPMAFQALGPSLTMVVPYGTTSENGGGSLLAHSLTGL